MIDVCARARTRKQRGDVAPLTVHSVCNRFTGILYSEWDRITAFHPSVNGVQMRPSTHLQWVLGYTLEVAGCMHFANTPWVRDNLESFFRDLLWAHNIDSKRRTQPRLDKGCLAEGFSPWFLFVEHGDVDAARIDSSRIEMEPRALLSDPLRLFGLQCLVAQCFLGGTREVVLSTLSSPIRLSAHTLNDFQAVGQKLPSLRASQLAVLQGGDAAFLHINAIIATVCGTRIVKSCGIPLGELAEKVVLINSATPYYYVLSSDGQSCNIITPDGWVLCKMARIECGFSMPSGYASHSPRGSILERRPSCLRASHE